MKVNRSFQSQVISPVIIKKSNHSCSHAFNNLKYLFILFFTFLILINGYSQIPELPSFVRDTFYIDPTNPKNGDGTIGNPWNCISTISSDCYSTKWPRAGWDLTNAAILFKRGTVMFKDNPRSSQVWFTADSIYIGSYGTGAKAKFLFNSRSRAFRVRGTSVMIQNLEVANLDTMNYSEVVSVQGLHGADLKQRGTVHIDSLVISSGFRGLAFGEVTRGEVSNSVIYNLNHDGIYSGGSDTLIFRGLHIYKINKDWAWNRSEQQSGGDCIQVEGVANNRIRLVVVEDCILDRGHYGNKFNLIVNQTDSTVIRNTTFIGHPGTNKGIYGTNLFIDNCYFEGFDVAIWNIGRDVYLYNSVFVGFGRDFTFENDVVPGTPLLHGAYTDIYNCVFVDIPVVFRYPNRNLNIRNSIFYNVTNPFYTGMRRVHGSGNIHYNPDGTMQESLGMYLDPDSYIVADPKFVDPVTEWKKRVVIPGVGEGSHTWYEATKRANFRLQPSSPAINKGDPRVYDTKATFLYGTNQTQDLEYVRPFTQNKKIERDKAGNPRPMGGGFDIGAYEFFHGHSVPVNNEPLEENGNETIHIYPNPATDYIYIDLPDSQDYHSIEIQVSDQVGRVVGRYPFNYMPEEISIPISNLIPGLYFIRFIGNGKSLYTGKLIKN